MEKENNNKYYNPYKNKKEQLEELKNYSERKKPQNNQKTLKIKLEKPRKPRNNQEKLRKH